MLSLFKSRASSSFRFSVSPRCALVLSAVLLPGTLLLGGCEESAPKKAEPKVAHAKVSKSLPKSAHPPARKRAKRAKPADIVSWSDPKGLTKIKPKNSFRRASYEVAPAKGETKKGILNVFAFGGDVDSNLERWKGQFTGLDAKTVKRTDRTVNDLKQTILEIPKGKYSGGMAPEEGGDDYGMLAALVPVAPPKGGKDVLYIFKMTGPSGGIAAAKPAFQAMLDSIKRVPAAKPAANAKPAAPAAKAAAPATKH